MLVPVLVPQPGLTSPQEMLERGPHVSLTKIEKGTWKRASESKSVVAVSEDDAVEVDDHVLTA